MRKGDSMQLGAERTVPKRPNQALPLRGSSIGIWIKAVPLEAAVHKLGDGELVDNENQQQQTADQDGLPCRQQITDQQGPPCGVREQLRGSETSLRINVGRALQQEQHSGREQQVESKQGHDNQHGERAPRATSIGSRQLRPTRARAPSEPSEASAENLQCCRNPGRHRPQNHSGRVNPGKYH
jgi:hypothetical protein